METKSVHVRQYVAPINNVKNHHYTGKDRGVRSAQIQSKGNRCRITTPIGSYILNSDR